jgi:hypothetical protein
MWPSSHESDRLESFVSSMMQSANILEAFCGSRRLEGKGTIRARTMVWQCASALLVCMQLPLQSHVFSRVRLARRAGVIVSEMC